jgi:hypothetical protein
MQRYPGSIRTHEVPGTGTAGFLPYRCFLDFNIDEYILVMSYRRVIYDSVLS